MRCASISSCVWSSGSRPRASSPASSMSEPRMRSVLDQLARLHARFWNSPRFAQDLDWLWTPVSGGFHDFLLGPGGEFLRDQVHRSEYKQSLLARLGRTFDEAWHTLWNAQRILASGPTTLLHGDAHVGNSYLLPGDRMGLLDWQLMLRGRWSHDVTYILITALDTEPRRCMAAVSPDLNLGLPDRLDDHALRQLRGADQSC
ncbi:MAG: hypothetical protein EPO25_14745 [Gammaproteobacteria bacterium]|nr:MAG: hypothetical protein EPO25_14745 [Gammaproteobacteria bacterium]